MNSLVVMLDNKKQLSVRGAACECTTHTLENWVKIPCGDVKIRWKQFLLLGL